MSKTGDWDIIAEIDQFAAIREKNRPWLQYIVHRCHPEQYVGSCSIVWIPRWDGPRQECILCHSRFTHLNYLKLICFLRATKC